LSASFSLLERFPKKVSPFENTLGVEPKPQAVGLFLLAEVLRSEGLKGLRVLRALSRKGSSSSRKALAD
jgi:hypothetical protein